MAARNTPEFDYCTSQVRARDEDRWLAAHYASPKRRRLLIALYAFHNELRRVPSVVSEPPLGEIRLQWWRDALEEIRCSKPVRAHPIVLELAAGGLASAAFKPRIDTMIDAAARPLYSQEFAGIADLEGWLAQVSGAVEGLAVLLLGGGEKLADIAARSSTAFALAREGNRWAPSLSGDIISRAKTVAMETAPALRKAPSDIAPALLHLSLTNTYAMRGDKPFELTKRLRIFLAMAFRLY